MPWKKIAVVGFASAILMEVVLQVWYLGIWLFYPAPDTAVGESDRVVLCVGDSFTYGAGKSAPDRSYPAQLEAILRDELGPQWRVVNQGWPGRNSRDLLLQLRRQLTEAHPSLVYCIVGCNDFWSRPHSVTPAELAQAAAAPDHAYRLEYRTLRLLKVFSVLNPYADDSAVAPITTPTSTRESRSPMSPERFDDLTAAQLIAEGRRALEGGEYDRAEAVFRYMTDQATAGSSDELWGHFRLLRVYSRAERPERFEELAWIEAQHRRAPAAESATCWLQALQVVGRVREGADIGQRLTEAFPDHAPLWYWWSVVCFEADDLERARQANDRAVALLTSRDELGAELWVRRMRIYQTLDPVESLRSKVIAYCTQPDEKAARIWMKWLSLRVPPEQLERIFDEVSAPSEAREVLRRVYGETSAEDDGPGAVYRQHLRQILRLCRQAGAEVVVATYPFGSPVLETQREEAGNNGAGFLPLHERFQAEQARHPEIEYFISDGHCNDNGYRLMAEIVAEDAVKRLAQK